MDGYTLDVRMTVMISRPSTTAPIRSCSLGRAAAAADEIALYRALTRIGDLRENVIKGRRARRPAATWSPRSAPRGPCLLCVASNSVYPGAVQQACHISGDVPFRRYPVAM